MKKIIILGLIVLLFIAACDKKSPINTTKSSDVEAEQVQADKPVQDTLSNKLKSLFAAAVKYTVSYDITTELGDDTMSTVSSHYVDAPDKLRTDTTYQGIESRTYILSGTFTSCSNQGGWTCRTLPKSEAKKDDIADTVKGNVEEMEITKLPDRRVAGTTAECYQMKSSDYTAEYCFKSSIPLYVEITSAGMHVVQEATSYSTSVKSSDFDLPADPTEIKVPEGIPEGVHIPGLT